MPATFSEAGVRFLYPENWQLERQENEDGWTVVVQSPATAFLMLYFRQDLPDPSELADAALVSLKKEYEELEAEPCVEALAGQPAVGHNIHFFSLDLTNTCWTRGFYSANGTVLVLCQLTDFELSKNEPVLRAICASIKLDDE